LTCYTANIANPASLRCESSFSSGARAEKFQGQIAMSTALTVRLIEMVTLKPAHKTKLGIS
jgi:hypothetical protein